MIRSLPAGRKFPKKLRLYLRSDFINLRKKGKKLSGNYLYMILAQDPEKETKFAVSVSKRVGNSVKRSRLKRRIKEIFRQNRESFPSGKHILIWCKKGAAELDYRELKEEIFNLLDKDKNNDEARIHI